MVPQLSGSLILIDIIPLRTFARKQIHLNYSFHVDS